MCQSQEEEDKHKNHHTLTIWIPDILTKILMCLERLGPLASFAGRRPSSGPSPSPLSPAQADDGGGDETGVIIAITTKNRDGDDDHRQDPAIFSCPKCDNHENSNRMKSIERLKSFALQQWLKSHQPRGGV